MRSYPKAPRFMLISAIAVTTAACAAPGPRSQLADESPAAARSRAPNILLITVDDLGWNSLGVTGSPMQNVSPNIDRLAGEGVIFDRAHVTVAICHPTRNVWLTGRYPQNTGALGFEDIAAEVPTLVEAVKASGYYTGLMGKTPHVLPARAAVWHHVVAGRDLQNGRSPDRYFEHTRDFIARAKAAGQPFFLMVNSHDPHRPFSGSQQEENFKTRDANNADSQYGGGFPAVAQPFAAADVRVPGSLPDLPPVRQELAEYYTSVRRMDATTGAILRALDASGLAGETLVMWLSDNGMSVPFAKANVYYNSTRTPWIVRWPNVVSPGRRDDRHAIGGVDLAPTLLGAAGLPPLPGTDGRSFLPILRNQSQAGRDIVFTQIDNVNSGAAYPMRAVTGPQFTYIFNAWSNGITEHRVEAMQGRTWPAMQAAAARDTAIAARARHFVYRTKEELYDIVVDPDALQNLIADPKHAAMAAEYRALLLQHMKQFNDPQLAAFEAWLAARR